MDTPLHWNGMTFESDEPNHPSTIQDALLRPVANTAPPIDGQAALDDTSGSIPPAMMAAAIAQVQQSDARVSEDGTIIRFTDGTQGNAAHLSDLPAQARMVVNESLNEAWRTVEAGDEVTEETVAADIAQRLHDLYGATPTPRTAPPALPLDNGLTLRTVGDLRARLAQFSALPDDALLDAFTPDGDERLDLSLRISATHTGITFEIA